MALNYMGQQIPVTNFRVGGGYYSPQQAQNDLAYQKWQKDQQNASLLFNEPELRRQNAAAERGDPAEPIAPPPSAPPAASGSSLFGGFNLLDALKSLTGASTDTSTTVADMSQTKKGTFDALAQLLSALGVSQNSLMGSLAQTAMSGKLGLTNADVDAQKANQAAALAASQSNQARDKRLADMALFQGLIGSNVSTPGMREISTRDIDRPDTNVDLESFFRPAAPAPVAALPAAEPPEADTKPWVGINSLMNNRGIKPFRLPPTAARA